MLRNLVVGLDGGPSGRRALEWAVGEQPDEVHVVHAVSPSLELLAAAAQIDTGPLIARITEQLEGEWTDGLTPGRTKVFTRLLEDSPTAAMLATAKDRGADAIVVGPRGDGSPSRIVGATTSHLVHLSTLPVVVVPGELAELDELGDAGGAGQAVEAGPSDAPTTDDRDLIVVAVTDRPDDDGELVAWAARAARDGTRLRLVLADESSAAADDTADRLRQWLSAQDVALDGAVRVVAADPITALVDASEDASMIVVGSHQSSRLVAYITGAVANHLPAVSRCPVALVPLTHTRH